MVWCSGTRQQGDKEGGSITITPLLKNLKALRQSSCIQTLKLVGLEWVTVLVLESGGVWREGLPQTLVCHYVWDAGGHYDPVILFPNGA